MAAAFAFGLGMVVGALLTFRAGVKTGMARHYSAIAGEHLGIARRAWSGASGQYAIYLLALVGGIVIMFISSR
jgi:hypothetical protein